MTGDPMILALPSKGRLREALEDYLGDLGLRVEAVGGARGYAARLRGLDGVEVRLISAGDIAAALHRGDVHMGVTGLDLLEEHAPEQGSRATALTMLGFGHADVIVAVPTAWIDVDTMADLEEVAQAMRLRRGRRLRVATKYGVLARRFFAKERVTGHRIVESAGATEGAPAAGHAEAIVDITTTGRTLSANSLKILSDGVILRSQACLAAAAEIEWSASARRAAERLCARIAARTRAAHTITLHASTSETADLSALEDLGADVQRVGTQLRVRLAASGQDDAAEILLKAGAASVTVQNADFVYACEEPLAEALRAVMRSGS